MARSSRGKLKMGIVSSGNDETVDIGGKSLTVQVLRSRTLKRVIYIESGKVFVDILLSLLAMPVGGILKLLEDAGLASRINIGLFRMYASVNKLETTAFIVDKKVLVQPCTSASDSHNFLRISNSKSHFCLNPECPNATSLDKQFCSDCGYTIVCANCSAEMSNQIKDDSCTSYHCCRRGFIFRLKRESNVGKASPGCASSTQNGGAGGFVKENITFIIKEDLSILKSSTISSLALLQEMKVERLLDLDTKDVLVGPEKGLELVLAAFVSSKPLTDVFEYYFSDVSDKLSGGSYL